MAHSRHQNITYIVLKAITVIPFLFSVILIFSKNESVITQFTKWNLIKHIYLIAGIELTALALYIFPKTVKLGTLLISTILGGSIATILIHNGPYYFQLSLLIVIWINELIINPKKFIA